MMIIIIYIFLHKPFFLLLCFQYMNQSVQSIVVSEDLRVSKSA